ncbi:MAG: Gfo/Idh/MocA family protein [Clostridiaceae bacterium]
MEIGYGIVGTGMIAKTHIIALKTLNLVYDNLEVKPKFNWVCTRSKENKFEDFKYSTKDIEDIINDSNTKIIDICTPNFMHYDQGKKVILADKNLYMEKPSAKDINDAKELAELSEKSKIVNQTALMFRFIPAVVLAKDYIDEGNLGEILNFRIKYFHKSYLNSERPMSWRLEKEASGGGALVDLGIHMVDLVRFLMGEVKDVHAKTSIHVKERYKDSSKKEKVKSEVDEWALLDLNLINGGYGTLEVSRISSDLDEDVSIEIYGTKGKVEISTKNPNYPEIFLHEKGILIKGELERKSEFSKYHKTIYPSSRVDLGWFMNAHMASLVNFLLNVQEGKIVYKETPTLMEAYKSQKIIDMAYKSENEGRRINID